jgi:transcriptional regulator with XRE-family HTH domain
MGARRDALGLTQEHVAQAIGLSPKTVANYEQGLRHPSPAVLAKIAEALKCPADWLLGIDGKPPPVPTVAEWFRSVLGDLDSITEEKDREGIKALVKTLAGKGFAGGKKRGGPKKT